MGSPSRLSDAQFAAIARALAEPRRLGILGEVAASSGPLSCCALQEAGKVSAATISHHVKGLEAAGLIDIVRDGKFARLIFRRDMFDLYLQRLSETLRPAP